MTGYTVHTGSTEKFSKGWDQIFKQAGKAKKKPAAPAADTGKAAAKKRAKKSDQ